MSREIYPNCSALQIPGVLLLKNAITGFLRLRCVISWEDSGREDGRQSAWVEVVKTCQ